MEAGDYVMFHLFVSFFFFLNDTATTEIYTLFLHDALPIWRLRLGWGRGGCRGWRRRRRCRFQLCLPVLLCSTRRGSILPIPGLPELRALSGSTATAHFDNVCASPDAEIARDDSP